MTGLEPSADTPKLSEWLQTWIETKLKALN